MIKPAPHKAAEQALMPTIHAEAAAKAESDAALTPVLKLRAFERFVFVMSVLEGYSDQDCSILLGCSRRAVALARIRAAERIAGFAESGMSHAGASPDVLARKGWLAQSA
jgi:DNA-directed RNA polymerase specialized sigma24 family protein